MPQRDLDMDSKSIFPKNSNMNMSQTTIQSQLQQTMVRLTQDKIDTTLTCCQKQH